MAKVNNRDLQLWDTIGMHSDEVNFKGNKENGCHTCERVVTLKRKRCNWVVIK